MGYYSLLLCSSPVDLTWTLEQVEMGLQIVEYYIMVNYKSFVLLYTKEMLWIRYSTSIFFSTST